MYCKHCNEPFNSDDPDKFDRHLTFVHGTNHWDINQKLKELKIIAAKLDSQNN